MAAQIIMVASGKGGTGKSTVSVLLGSRLAAAGKKVLLIELDSGLRSVTVIDEASTRADALTTALFVMGLEDGMAFCAANDIAAVFVTADKQVHVTDKVGAACTFTFLGEEKGYTHAQ